MSVRMENYIPDTKAMELYDEGVSLLTRHMGVVKAEQFISVMLKFPFDYTKWHQEIADSMTSEDFSRIIEAAEQSAPYAGAASTII